MGLWKMLNAIYVLSYSAFFVLGVFFARRWLLAPPAAVKRFPRVIRVAALIVGCWGGCFAAASFSNTLGYWISDGIACDEGVEMSYYILYDGVGNNAWNLLVGWLSGFIAWGVAMVIHREGGGPVEDGTPDQTTR